MLARDPSGPARGPDEDHGRWNPRGHRSECRAHAVARRPGGFPAWERPQRRLHTL